METTQGVLKQLLCFRIRYKCPDEERARRQSSRDLLSKLPSHVAQDVTHERKYSLTRQLISIIPEGGEKCWIFREALLNFQDLEVMGVEGFVEVGESEGLRVRVEDHLTRRDKRTHFFRAVRALENQLPRTSHDEKGVIVDVRLLKIYGDPEHITW